MHSYFIKDEVAVGNFNWLISVFTGHKTAVSFPSASSQVSVLLYVMGKWK